MRVHFKLLLGLAPCLVAGFLFSPEQTQATAADRKVSFDKDVKPILSNKCFKCHGPDAATVAAGLRLDKFETATADREGGPAIVPHKPESSKVMVRVTAKDWSRMPPEDAGVDPLTADEIDILRAWIQSGATYTKHWSLIPPKKPEIPQVERKGWAKNPIDNFILKRLEDVKLEPNPEASKEALLNRAYLSAIGLPPTPKERAEYLADKSPNAYEKLVDKLLARKEYGEHVARYWLDAVRYGDTHGLHLDNERGIYPYRDWVVRAFNEDLPFDKFTLWQVAGDMLPDPQLDQLIATGFIRMNPTTAEGGAIEEEFLVRNTFDRVDTLSTIYLGLTVACAKCHDHKYDPISQKEYYQLFAYLNNTEDAPLDGNLLYPPPVIDAPSPEQRLELASLEKDEASVLQKVNLTEAEKWLSFNWRPEFQVRDWQKSKVYQAQTFQAAFDTVYDPENQKETESGWSNHQVELEKPTGTVIGKDNAAIYFRFRLVSEDAQETILNVSSDDGVKVWVNNELVHSNPALRQVISAVDQVKVKLKKGENTVLIKLVNGGGGDDLLVSIGTPLDKQLRAIQKKKTTNDNSYKAELAKVFLQYGPENKESKKYREILQRRTELLNSIPKTLVAKERMDAREAYLLKRGEYNLREEKVERALPEVLGKLPEGAPNNRLGLAKWLVDKNNPLVARVFVNRVWQQFFGTGLVKTSEDFGSQGEWPSHPELLDYLAIRFMEDGWSVKKLNRLILTSATFKQSAKITPGKYEIDPENRLLARSSRVRLDAEVIRDRALAASGLLVQEMGGKGFKPYQPEGLWEALAFADSTTAKYVQDKGPTIYRRSLYLFWKRTSPPPVMMAFDAPMRESCSVRRSRTNTPLQALVTLNEPAFVEAARTLAGVVYRTQKTDDARIRYLYQRTLGRDPRPEEALMLKNSLEKYREEYIHVESGAEGILRVGDSEPDSKIPAPEYAAWTLLASTLMNTDEFLTMP